MSKSDYEYTTPKQRFDVIVNAVNYVSMVASTEEQFKIIWNEAIDCAISKTGKNLNDLKV